MRNYLQDLGSSLPMEKTLILMVVLTTWLMTSVANARSEIYRHVDSDGRITYANKPTKGADRLQIDAAPPNSSRIRSNKGISTVSSNTQKKRDIKRRQILENELALETKLLADFKQKQGQARNNLNVIQSAHEATEYKQEIKWIQRQVLLHTRNIAALKKELSGLK